MMDTLNATREDCLAAIWDSDRSRARTFVSSSGALWSSVAWYIAATVADPRLNIPRDLELKARHLSADLQEAEAVPLDWEHFQDYFGVRLSIEPTRAWEKDLAIQKNARNNKRALLESVLQRSDLQDWEKEVFIIQVVEGRRVATCPHCACLHSVEFISSACQGTVFFLTIVNPDPTTSWSGLHPDHPQWQQLVNNVCWDCSIDGPPEVS